MASIVKRKNKYSVVYAYFDEAGKRRQRWETFDTNAEAKKRKAQIEYEQESGTGHHNINQLSKLNALNQIQFKKPRPAKRVRLFLSV